MGESKQQQAEFVIENPLGFHVRPIQRFAEMARAFRGEIEVEIEGRKASGKSVMGLMSLGGRHGSKMKITTCGEDARQALAVLGYLVEHNFFVEDDLESGQYPDRHIERLVKLASCFESSIWVTLGGQTVPGHDGDGLRGLGLEPTSQVKFKADGPDGEQAHAVLGKLLKYQFYVEEAMDAQARRGGG